MNARRVFDGMRYRRLNVRYTMVTSAGQAWPFGEMWQTDRVRLLAQAWWRPDADVYETAATVELVVDLAGVEEDDIDVQLFDDVLVVEGRRSLPAKAGAARYHAAGIRQGPFRLDVRLPVLVDAEQVEARYERGLLRITLAKREGA
jgi:HSP20 family molecular chaperone IbpA